MNLKRILQFKCGQLIPALERKGGIVTFSEEDWLINGVLTDYTETMVSVYNEAVIRKIIDSKKVEVIQLPFTILKTNKYPLFTKSLNLLLQHDNLMECFDKENRSPFDPFIIKHSGAVGFVTGEAILTKRKWCYYLFVRMFLFQTVGWLMLSATDLELEEAGIE
jgi:hypothetical protein